MVTLTALLAAAVALAACTSAAPADPVLSLKHDTDVVRMARLGTDNRRLILVDVLRAPLATPDPVLTNEVDTSADSDLPRLVRVLVPAPEEPQDAVMDDYLPRPAPADGVVGLDADTEQLTRLLPPAADQPASAADWDASTPAPGPQQASLSEELLPPPAPAASEPDLSDWTRQAAQPRADAAAAADDDDDAVKEPSGELQPPQAAYAGLWELFEGLKMAKADEAVTVDGQETPVTELAPPSPPAAGDVDYWTKPAGAAAQSRADESVDDAKETPAAVAEPATDLVPPAPGQPDVSEWTRDSYSPEKPSSGEAGADDFLSVSPGVPADAEAEYAKDHSDSYLPEAGELKPLSVGPVYDDFLAIGEPPKEDDKMEEVVAEAVVSASTAAPQPSAAAAEDSSSNSENAGADAGQGPAEKEAHLQGVRRRRRWLREVAGRVDRHQ